MELNLYGFGFWYGKLNVFNKNKNLLSNIYAMHKAQRKAVTLSEDGNAIVVEWV